MINNVGGLSVPVKVHRGIKQGCPLSGQLYSIVTEPLLCKLRNKLTCLRVAESAFKESILRWLRELNVLQLQKTHANYGHNFLNLTTHTLQMLTTQPKKETRCK